jgi:hypothetical protein
MGITRFIGDLFFFSRKKSVKTDDANEDDSEKNSLLCRFVLDGAGKKVGESIAINNDLIIIKARDKYLGVPLKHIEEDGKTLMVKGLVDKDKAEEMGERWRKLSFNDINSTLRKNDGF